MTVIFRKKNIFVFAIFVLEKVCQNNRRTPLTHCSSSATQCKTMLVATAQSVGRSVGQEPLDFAQMLISLVGGQRRSAAGCGNGQAVEKDGTTEKGQWPSLNALEITKCHEMQFTLRFFDSLGISVAVRFTVIVILTALSLRGGLTSFDQCRVDTNIASSDQANSFFFRRIWSRVGGSFRLFAFFF